MWKNLCFVAVSLCLTNGHGYTPPPYEGYEVHRVTIRNNDDAQRIHNYGNHEGIELWSGIDLQNKRADIMVSPKMKRGFLTFLYENAMNSSIIIDDVSKISDLLNINHQPSTHDRPREGDANNSTNGQYEDDGPLSQYMSYEQMQNYSRSLETVTNPETGESLAVIENIGESYLGKDVIMIKISSNHSMQKPIVLMEAGTHAREWAGPPTVLFLAHQLVENYTANKDMLQNVDFYLIPMTNPDGYEYSRNYDRLWRKTRSKYGRCYGADINRNFRYFWGKSESSSEPCNDTYMGPTPFSEPEARNIRNVGLKYRKRLLGFIAVHSYGGYLLYPWGYTANLPKDWDRLDVCASSFVDAVAKYSRTQYTQGCTSRVLYKAAGGSDDWMKGRLKVPFAYTLELASSKEEGFHLRREKLPMVEKETFVGFKAFINCFWHFHVTDQRYDGLKGSGT